MENFGLQIPGVYFSGQNTDVGIALNFNDGGHLQTAINTTWKQAIIYWIST